MNNYGKIDQNIALSFPADKFVLHYEREYHPNLGNHLNVYYGDNSVRSIDYNAKNIQLLEDKMDTQVIKIFEYVQTLPDNDKKVLLGAIMFGGAGIIDTYAFTQHVPEVLLTIGTGCFFYSKLKKAFLLNDLEKNYMIVQNKERINEHLKANRDFRYWQGMELSSKAEEVIREKLITNSRISVNDGDFFTKEDIKKLVKGN